MRQVSGVIVVGRLGKSMRDERVRYGPPPPAAGDGEARLPLRGQLVAAERRADSAADADVRARAARRLAVAAEGADAFPLIRKVHGADPAFGGSDDTIWA
jgi:hypothetical protein